MSETRRSVTIDAPEPYGGTYHEFEPGEWRHSDAVAGYSESWVNVMCNALAAARAEVEAMKQERDVFVRGLVAVRDLVSESRGVYGLHLNGDESPWESLQTGGMFEGWLVEFDAALGRALAAQEGA